MTSSGTTGRIRLPEAARAWRAAQTGRVVFTNGVFDLLHTGHADLLEAARALGDVLIVGINTDASAAGLEKGPGRPFVPQDDRARLVAALAAVDCVVLFDTPTPEPLVEALLPDILVKGDDWSPAAIPGAAAVRARGGTVTVLPRTSGRSTTALVERIRAAG